MDDDCCVDGGEIEDLSEIAGPDIPFTDEELSHWSKPWKHTLIVKTLGEQNVNFQTLENNLQCSWTRNGGGTITITDMANGFFSVQFTSEEDYNHALYHGPLKVADYYLLLQRWRPLFSLTAKLLQNVVVWIRIPKLPVELCNQSFLWRIGSTLGVMLKVDDGLIGRFARICVEVDLGRGLVSNIMIRGNRVNLEYEGLYGICFRCGQYGHRKDSCVERINEVCEKMQGKIEECVRDFVGKEVELCFMENLIGECREELKTKEIELREVMGNILKEKELEGQVTELVNDLVLKEKYFESRMKELESKEKPHEGRVNEHESKKRKFEGQGTELVNDFALKQKHFESRMKDLESKEKQHEGRVKEHDSKAREFEGKVKELESKEKHFESQIKDLESKEKEHEGRVKEHESQKREFEGQVKELESKKKQFDSRVKELESNYYNLVGQTKEFLLKEREFESKMKRLVLKKKHFESRMKELEVKEKQHKGRVKEHESKAREFEGKMKELESTKKHFESQVEELKSKERQLKGQVTELEGQVKEFKSKAREFFEGRVNELRPGTDGHTLMVKVVSSSLVRTAPYLGGRSSVIASRPSRIAECLIGDETASIIFTARNEQVDLMNPGATLILRNAKIDMFKGSMRLAVDRWGRIEVTEPASFEVREDNNLSLIEYELVNVVEE